MNLDLTAEARPLRPQVHALDSLRKPAIATWKGRMINEHGSARVFEGLAEQFDRLGAGWETAAKECRTFAAEERHHGAQCGAVAEALGGIAVAEIGEPPVYPLHSDVGGIEATARNLLSIACMSETVAVALIAAEREEMPDGELRELLTRIWADECGHARFGWATLPKLLEAGDPGLRDRLRPWLAVALAHLESHELAHLPMDAIGSSPEASALGLCSGPDARVLFYDTVEHVILPALEAQGLPAKAAWEERIRAEP